MSNKFTTHILEVTTPPLDVPNSNPAPPNDPTPADMPITTPRPHIPTGTPTTA